MSVDDDQIRRALSAGAPSFSAHSALREMRPSMQRSRKRRRVAVSATAAAMLVSSGAGVFALTASSDQTTLRSVTSDQSDQTGEPVATVAEVDAASTTVATPVDALEESPSENGPPTTTKTPVSTSPVSTSPIATPADDGGGTPTERGEMPVPAVEMPPPTVAVPATPLPASPPAPVSPPPASSQTITSSCGDVVVSINAGTVRIVTIAARPGFDHSVSDDGPNSIEMTFRGEGEAKCEIHAELKSGRLDVEVQNP